MADFLQTGLGIALLIIGQSLLIVAFVMISLLFLVYGDRKIWAAVQMRRGPNVVGAFGLLQTVADALKYVVKEVVVPAGRGPACAHCLAPIVPASCLAMIGLGGDPVQRRHGFCPTSTWRSCSSSRCPRLEVYGVIMGGWASNSKYPFLGSLRSAAQMISYEVSLGLIIIGIIISTGSMNFGDIDCRGAGRRFRVSSLGTALPHFPMVFLFLISALAETNRPPFDLPEAESELVAGLSWWNTHPRRYLLFMAGEYIAIFLMCALMSLLFFGGWLSPIPGLPDGALWMVGKMAFFFFIFAMVKAITPRYRYDQLMRIGWKVFLPFSLAWVVFVAFAAKFDWFWGAFARWTVGG